MRWEVESTSSKRDLPVKKAERNDHGHKADIGDLNRDVSRLRLPLQCDVNDGADGGSRLDACAARPLGDNASAKETSTAANVLMAPSAAIVCW